MEAMDCILCNYLYKTNNMYMGKFIHKIWVLFVFIERKKRILKEIALGRDAKEKRL
jgi:hypothetical protein